MEFDLEMNAQGFIGNKVLPIVEVSQSSGQFGKVPVEQLLKTATTLRSPGSSYNRGDGTFEVATFKTVEHGFEEVVDDREAELYAEFLNADQIAAMRAWHTVLLNYEQRCADLIFNTTTWTGAALTTSITNEWDDATNATPIDDVFAARDKVWDNSGVWANALVINRLVFLNLLKCDQIQERIESAGAGAKSSAGAITQSMLAEVFNLDYIIVSGAATNSADEGQSVTVAPVWSNEYAMVCRVATGNDFREPCVGRTFHWSGDGSMTMGTVEQYRDESVRGDVIRVRRDTDEVVLYAQMGHLLSNITT